MPRLPSPFKPSRFLTTILLTLLLTVALPGGARAVDDSADEQAIRSCMTGLLHTVDPATTVTGLRTVCIEQRSRTAAKPSSNASRAEREVDRKRVSLLDLEPFRLFAHRPNYLVGYAYNDNQSRDSNLDGDDLQRSEAGFQISFKWPIARGLTGDNYELFMGYTNRSYWQLYNTNASAPFRTSDHEPELFLRYYARAQMGPFRLRQVDLGVNHQSNGQSGSRSRSWNRIVGNAILDAGRFSLESRLWYRIPESKETDDNPDIEDFLGYGQLRGTYSANRHSISAMYRRGLKRDGLELTWSFRLNDDIRLFTYFFQGHGETLQDYNQSVQRLGIGISLSEHPSGLN